jgi:hypothetical protein
MLDRFAKMIRTWMICRVGFDGSFPVVYRREMYFHIPRCGSLHDTGAFASGAAEHVYRFKSFHAYFSPPHKYH